MKTIRINSIVAICIPVLLLTVSSCSKKGSKGQQGQQRPIPVTPFIVKEKNVAYYDVYPATVSALEEISIRSEVSGYLTGIHFREGRFVEKGQKLYEIDPSKYRASYDQALAGEDIAKANLDKAQRDMERYQKLSRDNAIAEQTLADARTNVANAKMQLKAARAELQRAQTDLNYSIIKAPFSGVIGFSQVKKGAYVVGGQTILNGLSSTNPTGVDFFINSEELPYYRELVQQRGGLPDSTFLLSMPDGSAYPFPGSLDVIDRAVDPQTSTIRVRLIFPNKTGSLKAGMDARVKVLNKESGSQLVIPLKAVNEQMSEYFVYLIHGNKVKQKRIETGLNLGEMIVVNSGIQAGDTIVAEGLKRIRDGSTVTPAKEGNAGNKVKTND